MYGVIMTIDEELGRKILSDLTHKMISAAPWCCMSLSHCFDEENNYALVYTLKIKARDESETSKLVRKTYYSLTQTPEFCTIRQETEMCDRSDCFRPVAALMYEQAKKTILHDRYGESLHILHTHCSYHCGGAAMRIASTLEVDIISEDKRNNQFEHVLTWRGNKNFYSQQVIQQDTYSEGLELYASPYLGPFASRDDARKAARDYDEFA